MHQRVLLAGVLVAGVGSSSAVAQSYPVFKVADTSTQIPGAPAGHTFTSFDAPSASRNPIALGPETPTIGFRATGPNGLIGLYGGDPSHPTWDPTFTPFRFADTTTPVPPGGGATFSDFTRPTFGASMTSGFPVYYTGTSATGSQNVYRAGWGGGSGSPFGQSGFNQATAPSAMGGVVAFGQGDDGVMSLIVQDETMIFIVDEGFLGAPATSWVGHNPPGTNTRVAYTARGEAEGPVNQVKVYRPSPQFVDVQTIARLTTPIPGGTGTFTGFGNPAAGASSVYFRGSGTGGQEGIYEYRVDSPVGFATRIDRNSTVPGRPGVTFTGFSDPAAYHSSYLIHANLSDGHEALYSPIWTGNRYELTELISSGDVIGGKTIDALEISREAVGGALNIDYAFKATFTDGSQGIYVLKLPEPGALTLGLAGIALLARRRPRV